MRDWERDAVNDYYRLCRDGMKPGDAAYCVSAFARPPHPLKTVFSYATGVILCLAAIIGIVAGVTILTGA